MEKIDGLCVTPDIEGTDGESDSQGPHRCPGESVGRGSASIRGVHGRTRGQPERERQIVDVALEGPEFDFSRDAYGGVSLDERT